MFTSGSMARVLALGALVVSPILVACGGSSGSGNGNGNGNGNGGNDAGSGVNTTPDAGGGNQQTGDSGSGGNGGQDSGGGGTFTEASHAPFPTIANFGIPVIATPKIVAITFNNDANAAGIGSFVSSVGTSSWWDAVTKDYGVGAGTGTSVNVTTTLAANYTDDTAGGASYTWPAFVASTITTAANNIPAPDANTIYAFFLPSTTTVTLSSNGQTEGTLCTGVGGYHLSTMSGSTPIIYAVVGECKGAALGDRTFASELDLLTFSSSHEILEAATDPQLTNTAAGYYNAYVSGDQDDVAWNMAGDGEIADFCVDQFGFTTPDDEATAGSNVVERIWSISAAKAGTNPCLPVPSGEIYFNAAPVEGSDAQIVTQNTPVTFEVDAFSDAPKSWTLLAVDSDLLQAGTASVTASFAGGSTETISNQIPPLPSIAATNGLKAQLTLTLTAALSATKPFALVFLISHDGTNLLTAANDHYWPIVVTTSAEASSIGLMRKTGTNGFAQLPPEWRAEIAHKMQAIRNLR